MKEKRKFVYQRAGYVDKDDFVKCLRRMRQCGGVKQKAADKVLQIIGNIDLGSEELFKLTNHGENRIDHCVKYDLPGACRLVTVQNENVVWFLFAGDHEEVDRWLDANKGLTIAASKADKRLAQTRVAVPQVGPELDQVGVITEEDKPLFERFSFPDFQTLIPQTKLRRELLAIREGTEADVILETIELISDDQARELIFDLIAAAKEGRYDKAEMRLKLFRNEAEDALANGKTLQSALESGENTDSIVTFNDLPPEELHRLLDGGKFEEWMLFLHPEQQKIVSADFERPVILKGVSGSGKTVVLIHRARRLALKYPQENIGVLTLNRTLANLLKNLMEKLCHGNLPPNLHVEAYYDYFQRVLGYLGAEDYLSAFVQHLGPDSPMASTFRRAIAYHKDLANEYEPRSGETLEDTWMGFWKEEIPKDGKAHTRKTMLIDAIRGEFDAEQYIRDEFSLVRSAFPAGERSRVAGPSYYTFERKGRCINFNDKARKCVLHLLMRYEEYMLAGAMLDEMGLAQALFPSIKKLRDLPPDLRRRCLLIDEFQDFSTLELRLLKQIAPAAENGLFLTGDTVQKVLVKDFNLQNASLDRNYVRTCEIKKNYRNSRQILQAADVLIQKYGALAVKSDDSIEHLRPELAVRETARPIALKSNDCIASAWRTANSWIVDAENAPWSVCLVSANPSIIPLASILDGKPANLKAAELSGDYVKRPDTVSVGSLADVKGLEFSLIIVVGSSDKVLPSLGIPQGEQWRDAMRLYVAMTRGRDQVVLTYEEKPSEFLEAMSDFLRWDIDQSPLAPRMTNRDATSKPSGRLVARDTANRLLAPRAPISFTEGSKKPTFPPNADVILRSFFERHVYPAPHFNGTPFAKAYNRWLRPKNLDGVRVSELFRNREFRRDIAENLDAWMKPHGCKLWWD